MKKIIITTCLCLTFGFASMAQSGEFTTSRGESILPEEGDFAIGIDATPLLNFLGNCFANANNPYTPSFNSINEGTIFAKYFLQDDRALRFRLGLNAGSNADKGFVRDDDDPTEPNWTLEDTRKYTNFDATLGIGYELRRGKGRIQGFGGGEAIVGFGSSKTTYDYSNSFKIDRQNPTSYDFHDNNKIGASRVTEKKYGSSFLVGAGAFVGVEYFIAPRLSLGGEFNIRLLVASNGSSEVTRESWDGAKDQVLSQTTKGDDTRNASNFGLNTNTGSLIYVMFHF